MKMNVDRAWVSAEYGGMVRLHLEGNLGTKWTEEDLEMAPEEAAHAVAAVANSGSPSVYFLRRGLLWRLASNGMAVQPFEGGKYFEYPFDAAELLEPRLRDAEAAARIAKGGQEKYESKLILTETGIDFIHVSGVPSTEYGQGLVTIKIRTKEDAGRNLGFSSYLVINAGEARMAKELLLGDCRMPIYFNDGLHIVGIRPDGVFVKERDESCREWYFPSEMVGEHLLSAVEHARGGCEGDYRSELRPDQVAEWRERCAPRVAWKWGQKWGALNSDPVGVDSLVDEMLSRGGNLFQQLKGLQRIAENYSDGRVVEVFVTVDFFDQKTGIYDFYWEVTKRDDKRCVMNGGIICHNKTAKGSLEYSTHT